MTAIRHMAVCGSLNIMSSTLDGMAQPFSICSQLPHYHYRHCPIEIQRSSLSVETQSSIIVWLIFRSDPQLYEAVLTDNSQTISR